MSNRNLQAAKQAKNDEFFTQLADIEKEMRHYQVHFKNKTVYCNCDNPAYSQFWQYFKLHFQELGLKEVIATYHDPAKTTYASAWNVAGSNVWQLRSGDFREPECTAILQRADIIVTNPPFSLWREYISQLTVNRKKFIIIGPMNAITYKDVFPWLRDNKLWLGNNQIKTFLTPDNGIKQFGNVFWYTNLDHPLRHKPLILTQTYNSALFPKYENYSAIEVSKTMDIPCDYYGAMGVPISFLTKYCPDQFEILGLSSTVATYIPEDIPEHLKGGIRFYLKNQYGNYRRLYERLVIRRKSEPGNRRLIFTPRK